MRAVFAFSLALSAALSCAGQAGKATGTGSGGSGGASGYARCTTDEHCGQAAGCVAGTCLPRGASIASPLAAEIRPEGASAQAAFTEFAAVPAGGAWMLKASASVAVTAAFTSINKPDSFPSTSNVVLEIPSLIPGRPALTFEATTASATKTASLTVPDFIRGRSGTLSLIPLAPANQKFPPFKFSVAVPTTGSALYDVAAPTVTVMMLPSENLTPHGILVDALNDPKTTYAARAFQNGTQVSNSAATTPYGTFALQVPAAFAAGEVVIELSPSTASGDPWVTLKAMTLSGANPDLGTITLPTYQVPDPTKDLPVVFAVQGGDAPGTPVAGAAFRAVTTLAADDRGVTRFWRDATTDADGNASLFLVPGANRMPRTYDVSVVPAAGAPYAAKCVQQPVLTGGNIGTIQLSRRPVLSGTVSSALGAVVPGVTVVATRDAAAARVGVCAATAPTTVSTTTDATGAFSLALDPGVYQIDYDPPAGSSAPRLTQRDVDVSVTVGRPVQLPAPALIEGDVRDAADMPLRNATIRIFEPRCATVAGCTTPPWLRAETQSDANGHFRAVVAANPGQQ
jgi:carboxypeptidase family protein